MGRSGVRELRSALQIQPRIRAIVREWIKTFEGDGIDLGGIPPDSLKERMLTSELTRANWETASAAMAFQAGELEVRRAEGAREGPSLGLDDGSGGEGGLPLEDGSVGAGASPGRPGPVPPGHVPEGVQGGVPAGEDEGSGE